MIWNESFTVNINRVEFRVKRVSKQFVISTLLAQPNINNADICFKK